MAKASNHFPPMLFQVANSPGFSPVNQDYYHRPENHQLLISLGTSSRSLDGHLTGMIVATNPDLLTKLLQKEYYCC
jgi:hypothetical protein